MPTATSPRAVLVLIVAYRADDHLIACLNALGHHQPTVVVDNDANPATEAIVVSTGAAYLSAPRNLGFAAGVNLGLAQVWDGRSDVLLLNPDARLSDTGLSALHTALQRVERCAAVGPLLVGDDGQPQRARWPMPSPSQVWLDALGLGRMWRGRHFITGAVLLIRGEALAAIGRLDERFFLYAEEADWQLRALRAGWTLAVVPTVHAEHVGGVSSATARDREATAQRSGRLFIDKWYSGFGARAMHVGSAVATQRRRLSSRVLR